jgi:hypothetical protein
MSNLRPRVVSLLADHDPDRSDFSSRPWKLFHRDTGRLFTPGEAQLANSATQPEIQAALKLALAVIARAAEAKAANERLLQLLGPALEDGTLADGLAALPDAERAEATRLLKRWHPDLAAV